MKTLNETVAGIIADELAIFRDEVAAMVGKIAVPPFVPPHVWTAGRHSAGVTVRHRNGLFTARRDTDEEPPSPAWLPVLVGIASVNIDWPNDSELVLHIELSDGTEVETRRDFALPIARGFWKPDETYKPGERVLRFGDWQAAKPSKGVDPNGVDNDGHWLKVAGKTSRALAFRLDDDGRMFESGREIGTIKPLVAELLRDLTGGRA